MRHAGRCKFASVSWAVTRRPRAAVRDLTLSREAAAIDVVFRVRGNARGGDDARDPVFPRSRRGRGLRRDSVVRPVALAGSADDLLRRSNSRPETMGFVSREMMIKFWQSRDLAAATCSTRTPTIDREHRSHRTVINAPRPAASTRRAARSSISQHHALPPAPRRTHHHALPNK